MEIRKATYNVESYIVGNESKIKEKDILRYYNEHGYNAQLSRRYVKHIQTNPNVSKEIKELFNIHNSGYPDLMLIRKGEVSFIEIKLDNDSLRSNQVEFLEKLSYLAKTTVVYFNTPIIYSRKEFPTIKNYSEEEIMMLDQLEQLIRVMRLKRNKPLWVVAKMYELYKEKILTIRILPCLSVDLKLSKDRILWFIKERLENKEDVTNFKKGPVDFKEEVLGMKEQNRLDREKRRKYIIANKLG